MRPINKNFLFWLVLTVLILTTFFVLYFQKDSNLEYKPGVSLEYDKVAITAINLFNKEARKMDLSNGPCLTNDLIPGWVADIVHNPREEIDNLSSNQCQAYIEGRAKHFVELDTEGNIIRMK